MRVRILTAILAVAAVGLTFAGGSAYLFERTQALGEIDQRLLDRVSAVRLIVAEIDDVAVGVADEPDEFRTAAPETTESPSVTMRSVLDAVFRTVIPGSNESAVGLIDDSAAVIPGIALDFRLDDRAGFIELAAAEAASREVRTGDAEFSDRTIRYVVVPISIAESSTIGAFVAAIDVSAELAVVDSTFRIYAVVAAATLAAIALVGWFVAGRLLRPLRGLRDAASRMTATESAERIPVTGDDDVSELARTINDMLDRLAEATRTQRRLLDDVRHELKTPLTIVRGHLELLDSRNREEVDTVRALAIDEFDRMSELLDALAVLADIERDARVLEPIDIDTLTLDVFAKVSVISGHEWVLTAVASATARIDRARITQAWLQLADNAAKHSPQGTRIELGSRIVGDTVEMWVRDFGAGVPRGFEERIFERFGRADAGRGVEGSGLGLPIVRAIVDAHGGRVALDSSPRGARFALVVPLILQPDVTEVTL
ncbi:HAMP domain-containing sensor histidine kinase [uncultured Schumannella sp.]|uniref:sensor histidine kinase n=1 Tax=uncultured Schumannella sp. TaxID=1195956 RepID=UPI0025E59CD1|nr:HAMP domain-containing sensor histidine kinase [uncultured Schumannella sp.]